MRAGIPEIAPVFYAGDRQCDVSVSLNSPKREDNNCIDWRSISSVV
jgi:hypothetical protein